jgi:hypothetical protein
LPEFGSADWPREAKYSLITLNNNVSGIVIEKTPVRT